MLYTHFDQKLRTIQYIFRMIEVEAKMLFGNIFDYELDHRKNWVVFEADYEFKLLVMNGKKGENMDFLKLKQMFSFVIVFKTF